MKYYEVDLNKVSNVYFNYQQDDKIYVPSFRLELRYDFRAVLDNAKFLQTLKLVAVGDILVATQACIVTLKDYNDIYIKAVMPLEITENKKNIAKTFLMECVKHDKEVLVNDVLYDVSNKKMLRLPRYWLNTKK